MISKSKLLNAFSMERLVGKYTTPMNPTRWAPTPISKLMIPVAAIYRRYSIYSHNYVTNPICNWIRCASCLGPFFFETKNYCPFFFPEAPPRFALVVYIVMNGINIAAATWMTSGTNGAP